MIKFPFMVFAQVLARGRAVRSGGTKHAQNPGPMGRRCSPARSFAAAESGIADQCDRGRRPRPTRSRRTRTRVRRTSPRRRRRQRNRPPSARTRSVWAIVMMSCSLPRNANDEVRAMTFRSGILASRFKISSARPSLKYSFSLSALRLANGSTAIDGVGDAVARAPLDTAELYIVSSAPRRWPTCESDVLLLPVALLDGHARQADPLRQRLEPGIESFPAVYNQQFLTCSYQSSSRPAVAGNASAGPCRSNF